MFTKLTNTNSQIIIPFANSTDSEYYKRTHRYSTGIVVKHIGNIYSISSGIIIERNDNEHYLTIQYDVSICIRYLGLDTLLGYDHDRVASGEIVGTTKSNVKVEVYSTQRPAGICWTLRIGNQTLYKIDPTPYVSGELVLQDSGISQVNVIHTDGQNTSINIPAELQGGLSEGIREWLTPKL